MIIYSLITARSGSKGIKDKNITDYNGYPMIYYSISLSKNCEQIHKTFVSTDSHYYADLSKKYGAEVPFIRPKEIAQDLSTDYEVFEHFVDYLKENHYIMPDLLIHLRPTYPNRNLELLNDCISTFIIHYKNYDSLRTVCKIEKQPQKMYYIQNDKLIPYFNNYQTIYEPYNMPRQLFPDSYIHNGCIDIIKTNVIQQKSMSGQNIYPYIMDENNDIDSYEDLEKSKKSKNK